MSPSRFDFEGRWRRLREEVMVGIQEWRLPHPRATLEEIEAAVDERLARFRARRLQEVALASRAADRPRTAAPERPVCPTWGGSVALRGPRERRLMTHQGQPLSLERSDVVCPAGQVGGFPPR
jgi:hypothetical protein